MHALRPTRYLDAIPAADARRNHLPPSLASLAPQGIPVGVALTMAILGTLLLTVGAAQVAGHVGAGPDRSPAVAALVG
jgi:hypothetical protein